MRRAWGLKTLFLILLLCLGLAGWGGGDAFAQVGGAETPDTDGVAPPSESVEPENDSSAGEDEIAAAVDPQDKSYEVQVRQLEEKVNHLKEKIFRSKARLMLLQETILHGVIAGSKARITHHNTLGGPFKLDSVAYYLDGAPIFGKLNLDGSLDTDAELEIYNGTVQPGNHLLSVYLVYRGESSMFTYVEGVQIKLKSSYTFKAEEGKVTKVAVVGYDEGGVTTRFEDRPAVRFETTFIDLQEDDIEKEKAAEEEP